MSGFSVNVRTNADSVVTELLAAASETPLAVARALNKTADQIKVASSRELRAAGYGIKASDIKATMRIRRATSNSLTAALIAKGSPIALFKYGARKTSKGVSVKVLNGRKVIAGAFIATMPNGRTGVYVREPGAIHKKVGQGKTASWHALPIRELFGPSVPAALGNEIIQRKLQQFITEKFPKLLEHEHRWLASKAKR